MTHLPEQVRPLAPGESFRFRCHPGVGCFTECCRELELALSPYDVLRLRQNLTLTAQDFLDRYAMVEFGPDDLYPKVYLAMVDDGRASCPFVDPQAGCRVYPDRPAACRSYPLGRGLSRNAQGERQQHFVLLAEPHCQGFGEDGAQTTLDWQADQGLADYHAIDDQLLDLLPRTANRLRRLTDEEAGLYIELLYAMPSARLPDAGAVPADGLEGLRHAIAFLHRQWQTAR